MDCKQPPRCTTRDIAPLTHCGKKTLKYASYCVKCLMIILINFLFSSGKSATRDFKASTRFSYVSFSTTTSSQLEMTNYQDFVNERMVPFMKYDKK